MGWLKKLADIFNPAQAAEPLAQAGHITQNTVPLRTRMFTQPADPFSLEAITGKGVETAIQWEALPSEKHAGLWYVQQVSHTTIDGATTLDYGVARTPRYISYEEAVNILALMETSEETRQHAASPEPADYFRTHAEQEGFVQNTQGQLVQRSVEGSGGQFTQDSLKRAQENAQKAIAAQGGIFTSIFQTGGSAASLNTTLTVIENAAALESGLVQPLRAITTYLATATDGSERAVLGHDAFSLPKAPLRIHHTLQPRANHVLYSSNKVDCEDHYLPQTHMTKYTANAGKKYYSPYEADAINYACNRNVLYLIATKDAVTAGKHPMTGNGEHIHIQLHTPIGYSEDGVRSEINRALDFISTAPDHVLSPADKKQFKRLVAVAGIDALTRYAQTYFRTLAKDLTDNDDLGTRIKAMNADILTLKGLYLPDVSPAILQHIEQTIMSPEATTAIPVSTRICAAMKQWRESVINRLNQPGPAALPAVSGVAQGLLAPPAQG